MSTVIPWVLFVLSALFFVFYRREVLRQISLQRRKLLAAEADADRLAPIVRQYVKDIDDTAALLKDETPPPLIAEREALRLHDEALKLRSK